MSTEALRTVKDRFSEYVDRVENEHERVVVTRNGRPAIVLISTDDLASLEETISVLSDTDAIRALQAAEAAVAAGDLVRGVDAVRALRPPRQRRRWSATTWWTRVRPHARSARSWLKVSLPR